MDNCLANKFPELAKEWDFEKNGELKPTNVTYASGKKVWWKCPQCQESYDMMISNKIKTNCKCPYCSGHRACSWNCLNIKRPEIAKEWHPTLNGPLTPKDVVPGSGKKVWWLCPECHENYEAIIANRTSRINKANCPYCVGQKVCDWNCLATKSPDIAKQWHPTKNGKLTPKDVTCGCNKKVWWLCPSCNNSYESQINSRTRVDGSNCPYCAGQKASDNNCLTNKFPELIKEWDFERNGSLNPSNITAHSGNKAWWICQDCHESYNVRVADRTGSQSQGCPYCAGKKACNWNCLDTKRPDIANQWHPTLNGKLTPKDVTCGSTKKAWWVCQDCNKAYDMIINRKIKPNNNCPYCSGHRVCDWNCLATKMPDIAKQWHPTKNGKLTPKDVTCNHIKNKIWWICSYCGKSTKMSCVQATRNKSIICSDCNLYHQEEQVRKILEKITGKNFPKTRNIEWLLNSKTRRKYEADGYCEELNIMFEHQGPQHCSVYKSFHRKVIQDFFYQLYKDAEKYRLCKENNCLLICTYYDQTLEEIEEYIHQTLMANNVSIESDSNQICNAA